MTRLVTMCALVALAAGQLSNTAQAQSPERIAARCIAEVRETVQRCQRAAAAEVRECVPRIKRLVEAGQIEEAHQLARRCIASAEARTKRCVEHVQSVCRRCVNALLRLGSAELARRVAYNCREAIEDLRHILQREKHAIEKALHG